MQGLLAIGQLDIQNAPQNALLVQLSSKENWKSLQDKEAHDLVLSRKEIAQAFESIFTFFEMIGSLVRNRALDKKIARSMYGGLVPIWWNRFGNVVTFRREVLNAPSFGENWEWLAAEFSH